MAKGLLELLLDQIFDAEWLGRCGERLTEQKLMLVKLFGRDGKVLRNVYVPKDNGETSEIDVLFITQKGIFVFESKNYSGWIFGDESSVYWTVTLPNREKNKLYNPIKQNRTHIRWLGKYLGGGIPLFSIVVFSERCELKRVTVESPDVYVIKRNRIYATVRSIWDRAPDVLSAVQIAAVYEKLQPVTNVAEAVRLAHIDAVSKKYRAPQAAASTLICPECGGTLVLRTAKKGAHAGSRFYGCSNFPHCRYVRNLER